MTGRRILYAPAILTRFLDDSIEILICPRYSVRYNAMLNRLWR